MSMTRAQAATYLDQQFSALATQLGQSATDDSADGYGPDIDQALRQMGVGESSLSSATVADDDVPAFLALCDYYAARRFWRGLSLSTDVALGPRREQRSRWADTLAGIVQEAADRAAGLGYPVDATPAWSLDRLSLDFIEPEETSE